MRQFIDRELKGQVVILDSLQELIDQVEPIYRNEKNIGGGWHGREFANWSSLSTAVRRPWEDGLRTMSEFKAALARQLPEPEDVRRKQRWSDVQGEVQVDRLLTGDPVMFRDTHRRRTVAPTNVALVCNTGNVGDYSAAAIGWRGAAVVAAVDLLEASGYSCEIWMWNHAQDTFFRPNTSWFVCCRLKACGDPFDEDLLLSGLSAWYFRIVNIASRKTFSNYRNSGGSYPVMAGFDRHMDLTGNITRIDMAAPTSQGGAILAAQDVLAKATAERSGEL